ncbi:hypothetical protein TNCV_2525541 [Trichonephila clavipes]|nr:hypothetical protein TNCV_2525541 [Trichonephila clavipes]
MQDNVRNLTAHLEEIVLEAEVFGVASMFPWPKCYPKGLVLFRATHSARSLSLFSVRDVETALFEEWNSIS